MSCKGELLFQTFCSKLIRSYVIFVQVESSPQQQHNVTDDVTDDVEEVLVANDNVVTTDVENKLQQPNLAWSTENKETKEEMKQENKDKKKKENKVEIEEEKKQTTKEAKKQENKDTNKEEKKADDKKKDKPSPADEKVFI